MKRIVYSALLFLSVLISQNIKGQSFNFTVTPNQQCYYGPGTYTAMAAQTASQPGATSYSWTLSSPTPTCPGSYTPVPATNGTATVLFFSCCGVYTVQHFAFNGPNLVGSPVLATVNIVCQTGNSNSITASPSVICAGTSSTLTPNSIVAGTWIAQPASGGPTVNLGTNIPLVVTPSVNMNYTLTGQTSLGCNASATTTVKVSKASISVTPTNFTLCPGAPFTMTPAISVNNTSTLYTTGTATTGIQWFAPAPNNTTPFSTTAGPVTTTAAAGTYSAILSYTGAAGTCTLPTVAIVSTISTIQVNIGASQASVCPGAPVTLTANVATTPAATPSNIVWTGTVGVNPITSFTGSSSVQNPTAAAVYSVNITYYGCTGTNSIQVNMKTLTPTVTVSSPSSCPGQSVSINASGGATYTFTAYYANNPTFPSTYTNANTVSTVTDVLSGPQLSSTAPTASFVVTAAAAGCVGSQTVTIGLLTLNTQLIPSTPSICPNSTICLKTNNGCGTSNTITSTVYNTSQSYSFSCSSSVSPVSCFPTGTLNIPLTFSVIADSAGCQGTANLSLNRMILNPVVTPSSYSICPARSFSLSVFGGAGTSYTYTAPYVVSPPSNSVLATTNSNTLVVNTPTAPPLPLTFTVEADSAGCVGSSNITIGLLSLTPTLTASAASICPGSNFTLTSTGGAGTSYTFSADYTVSPGSVVIPTVTANTATNTVPNNALTFPHTYTVQADSVGCVGVATVQIGLLNFSPNVTLNAYANSSVTPSSSLCPGTSFTLAAANTNTQLSGTTSYSFYSQSGQLANSTSSSAITSTTLFPNSYTVVAQNSNCFGSQTVTVNRMYLNNLSLAASPSLVCSGMPSTLTASGVGSSTSSVTYTFASVTTSSVLGIGISNTIVVTPTIQTTYIVVADSAGCTINTLASIPATVTIFIRPNLVLTPSATSFSVCAGLPTTLSVTGPSTNINYTWSPAGITNFGTLTPGPAPSATAVANPTTNVTYTVNGSDPLGCVGSTVITIGIDPTASLAITITAPVNTVCPGLSTTLTASSNINPVTWAWSPTLGLNTFSNDTVISTPSLTTIYTATANNGWGCTGSASYTVIVNQFPNLTIVPTSSAVCAGYTSTLTAFGANSYTWTSASFSNAVAQQSLSVGPGTYSVLGSNGGGCLDSTFITIVNQPSLNIQVATSSPTTCIENNSPKYSKPVVLTASGANTYVWFPYNPIHMTYSLGPSTTVRPPATTQYTVIGSTNVCSGMATVAVNVIPQFTMNVVPPLPYMCLGDSLKLSIMNIGTLAVGPASAFNYSWTEAANAPPISISSKFTPTVMVYPQNTTTYSVEVRDSRACVSLPRLVTVTVLPRPITAIAIPTINNVPTNTVCFVGLNPGPDDVVLTLTGTNKNTNLAFGVVPTYTWVSPYPIKYNSILTPVNNNAVTVNAPIKLPAVVIYTLFSGYNGVQGCRRADTISVRVIDCRPVTSVFFTTAEKVDTICSRSCVTFVNLTDTAAGGTQTLSWQFPGGAPSVSSSSLQTVCYNLPGKYNVILTVANPFPKNPPNGQPPGSSNNLGEVSYVRVVDIPNVTIVAPGRVRSDTTVRIGTPINLHGSGASKYTWEPLYNISSLTDPNVTVKPLKNTQYILTGYNSKGCFSSDTINVIVIEDCGEMYIPNAFTPNNDGVNDVLYVRGICLKTLNFMVFNRWGEKVFETSDQNLGWDGSFKGQDLNTGVFVYRLEGRTYDGKEFSAKGNVTLIR